MKVRWTEGGRESLRDVERFLSLRAPGLVRTTTARLVRRSRQISEFPYSGRVVPEFGTDEVREVIEHRYRIWYRVKGDVVEVLAVVHGARDASD